MNGTEESQSAQVATGQPSVASADSAIGQTPLRPRRGYDLPLDGTPDEIREKLRADIENRLIDVCSKWSTGEFDAIVDDVTDTTLKYNGVE